MTTTKNDVFIFLLGGIDFWWGGKEGMSNSLAVGSTSSIPQVGKTLYIYICMVYIFNCLFNVPNKIN